MRKANRAGYALVELLVVISVNSVLMAVAVAALGSMLGSERQGQRHCEQTTNLMRMTDQFRQDVAAAREATAVAVESVDTLRLQGPDGRTIEFRRDGERLRRFEYRGSSIVRREAYTLRELSGVAFTVGETKMITLRLSFREDARDVDRSWRVEARLAKEQRFATAKPAKPENEP